MDKRTDKSPGRAGPQAAAESGDLGEFYLKALEFDQAEKQFVIRLPQVSGAERAGLLRRIGLCRERRGEYQAAVEILREAEEEARAAGDGLEEGRAAYLIAKASYLTGDLHASREVATRARRLLGEDAPPGERGAIENLLGGIAYREGEIHRARRHFEEALLLGKDTSDLTLLSRSHNNLGLIHKALCDWDQAIDSFHASLGFDSTASNYDSRYTAWINLGIVHAKRSEWQEAEAMFQRAYKTCVEVGNPLGQTRSLLGLAAVLRGRRDFDGIETQLAEAEKITRRHRYRREQVLIVVNRAWVALDQGELDACRQLVEEATSVIEVIAPNGELMCHLLRLAATLQLTAGDTEAAYATAGRCRELAERCGDRFERAVVARIEGSALVELGRWDAAQECFKQGVQDLRRMGERHELGLTLRDWGAGEVRHGAPSNGRSAIDRLREAANLLTQVGDEAALAPTYHALAALHDRVEQQNEALAALSRAWSHLSADERHANLRLALESLQHRIEARLMQGASPEHNRVMALVGLIESTRQADGRAAPLNRLLDQVSELVNADGALLAMAPALGDGNHRRLKAEAVSGLRLPEKRAILDCLSDVSDHLATHEQRVFFTADPRGGTLPFTAALAAVRTAGSMVVIALEDSLGQLWLLYLDRDRKHDATRPFSTADLELLSALAEQLPQLLVELGQRAAAPATAQLADPTSELDLGDFICEDAHLRELLRNVAQIRGSSIRVLLQGETGTGKGLLARVIHRNSVRRDRPFRVLNCATLPETLLESELFGHVRGAFAGASADKTGLLEAADGGTIFLEDIEKAGVSVQRGLLHFLDGGEIRPVGSTRRRTLDVRVICATSSANLEENVKQGSFSKDLFYRLHHFAITIPPLRERRASILPLARHFLRCFVEAQRGNSKAISAEAATVLEQCDWPGNVRELENAMRLAAVLGRESSTIEPGHLPGNLCTQDLPSSPVPVIKGTLQEQVEALETARVREALELFKGNKSRTAEHLGLTRKGLRNKMRRFGVEDSA